MKLTKLFEKRQWQCPGCRRVFEVPQRKADPLLCVDCTRREKARRRHDLLMAPFRFVGRTLKWTACGLLGLIGLVWVIGLTSSGGSKIERPDPQTNGASVKPAEQTRPAAAIAADSEPEYRPIRPRRAAVESQPLIDGPPISSAIEEPAPQVATPKVSEDEAPALPWNSEEAKAGASKAPVRSTKTTTPRTVNTTPIPQLPTTQVPATQVPATQVPATQLPSTAGKVWVKPYYRNGKLVKGYWRNK